MALSLANPILIINEKENLLEKIRNDYHNDEFVLETMDTYENLEKKHSQLLSTDLQLETSNQLILQFLLLFLSSTKTATIKGLQIMFKKANPYVLILSIIWSMKTSVSHTLNVIGLQKPFFPIVSKLVMASYAFFASSTK